VVSTEISHLKLQLQTSLSERGVFEMQIGQLSDDVRRAEAERDEVRLAVAVLRCLVGQDQRSLTRVPLEPWIWRRGLESFLDI